MTEKRKTDYEKNEDKFFRLLYPSINTLLKKFGFDYKIIRPCPRDFVSYEGKRKEADFIGLLDNGDLLNLEAHSSQISLEDKKKFFDYATYYTIKYHDEDIKVHTLVLSSYYKDNDSVFYDWHGSSRFTIPYKSLKTLNAEKTINKIRLKNKNNEELNKCEIDDLRILTFMKSDKTHEELLIESVKLTNEAKMDQNERAYTKTLQSYLARKFITDDKKYEEVMDMIKTNSEELSVVFDRYDRVMSKRIRKQIEEEVREEIREELKNEKEKIEKEKEEEVKKEKERNKNNIEEMKKEMKRRGLSMEDIQAICQVVQNTSK